MPPDEMDRALAESGQLFTDIQSRMMKEMSDQYAQWEASKEFVEFVTKTINKGKSGTTGR